MAAPKIIFFSLTIGMLILAGCSTVPLTGRTQLNIVPSSTMLSMSFQQYDNFLKNNKLSADQQSTQMVKRVGNRLKHAVEKYMTEKNMSGQIKNFDWEFNLVQDEQINAWCMPGGKVVVYSGILPVTKSETGLAVVVGHEIGHAIAKHGSERMSHSLMTQFGGIALAKAIEEKPQQTQKLYMAAFGVGSQLGYLLPYSRLHEYEADQLGLIFMAMAGYDPREAVDFWQRMKAMKEGASPPEFVSTHPADKKRIKHMKKLMPKAMQYYNRAK